MFAYVDKAISCPELPSQNNNIFFGPLTQTGLYASCVNLIIFFINVVSIEDEST